jgi:hypothetical protein
MPTLEEIKSQYMLTKLKVALLRREKAKALKAAGKTGMANHILWEQFTWLCSNADIMHLLGAPDCPEKQHVKAEKRGDRIVVTFEEAYGLELIYEFDKWDNRVLKVGKDGAVKVINDNGTELRMKFFIKSPIMALPANIAWDEFVSLCKRADIVNQLCTDDGYAYVSPDDPMRVKVKGEATVRIEWDSLWINGKIQRLEFSQADNKRIKHTNGTVTATARNADNHNKKETEKVKLAFFIKTPMSVIL